MNRSRKYGFRGKFARCFRAFMALAVCCAAGPRHLEAQTSAEVARAEAAYLRKILEFVEWAPGKADSNETFHVCVAGQYSISYPLAQELRVTTVEGRKIEVKMLPKEQSSKGCQVVFVSTPDAKQRGKILEEVKGAQVLTVGDDDGFLEEGGIFRFFTQGNLMQFEVNLAAARSAGLKIDARLLSMARRVVTERGTAGS